MLVTRLSMVALGCSKTTLKLVMGSDAWAHTAVNNRNKTERIRERMVLGAAYRRN
jgi:hypothetical protein